MAGTTPNYSIPYAQAADLVSAYPALDQSGMTIIDTTLASKTTTALPINAQTGTTYSFALLDAGKTVTASNAAASTYNIPLEASVAWVANTELRLYNIGAGTVTITCTSGTLSGTVTVPQYGFVTLKKTGTNTWYGIAQDAAVNSGGLVLVKTTSFTGVSSVSVNNCFTSAYENYKIVIRGDLVDDVSPMFRLRASGVSSSVNYNSQFFRSSSSATVNGGYTNAHIICAGGLSGFCSEMLITSPAVAAETYGTGHALSTSSGPSTFTGISSFTHTTASAYDGFELFPASGLFTGTVAVYGLKNS